MKTVVAGTALAARGGRGLAVVALALALGLPACGGGGGANVNGPSNVVPPPAVQRQILGQGNWTAASSPNGSDLTGDSIALIAITLNANATLDAVVDWTFSSNDVEIGFYQGSCNLNNLGTGNCANTLIESGRVSKPARISKSVAAGSYTLIIANFGPGSESGTWQVGGTK